MVVKIPWTDSELKALVEDPASRVFLEKHKIPVVLEPCHLQDLNAAVRDMLDSSVDCYHKSLDGILLSYRRLKILNSSGSVAAETSGVSIDIQAEFYIFRPELKCTLTGVVNKVSGDHVGILLLRRFNMSCPRPTSSTEWLGSKVSMHQEVTCKLTEKEMGSRLPFFKGKLKSLGNVLCTTSPSVKTPKKKRKGNPEVDANCSQDETDSIPVDISVKSKKRKGDTSLLESSKKNKTASQEQIISTKEEKKKSKKKNDLSQLENLAEEVPSKKAKKASDVESSSVSFAESPSKKKKKSKTDVDEVDFIPCRNTLDESLFINSPLPDHLPPPNADSTHFDLGKSRLSLGSNPEKKKKDKAAGLSAIKEESLPGNGIVSEISSKEDKKKKKSKKESVSDVPFAVPTVQTQDVSTKKKNKKTGENESAHETSSKSEKTEKIKGGEPKLNDSSKKNVSQKEIADVLARLMANVDKPLNSEETAPKSGKKEKSKKGKDKETKSSDISTISTPAKKPSQEPVANSASNKRKRKPPSDSEDEFIPAGQKVKLLSPRKQATKSPGIGFFAGNSLLDLDVGRKGGNAVPLMFGDLQGKIPLPPESPRKSPTSNKIPPSTPSKDLSASSPRKLMAVHTGSDSSDSDSGKVVKSPVKIVLPPPRRDSDSDSDEPARHPPKSPSPKKAVVNKGADTDSDSDELPSSRVKNALPSPKKSVSFAAKAHVDSSDDTDSESSSKPVTQRILQSMGVMQSPLTVARSVLKADSCDSDSDVSLKTSAVQKPAATHKKTKVKQSAKLNSSVLTSSTNMSLDSKASAQRSSDETEEEVTPAPALKADKSPAVKKTSSKLPKSPKKIPQSQVNAEDSDSDFEEVYKKALEKIGKDVPSSQKPASKPIGKKQQTQNSKALENLLKDMSDSDSGPDDRNTTLMMEQCRAASKEETLKKTKISKSRKVTSDDVSLKKTSGAVNNSIAATKKKTSKLNKLTQQSGGINSGTKVEESGDETSKKESKGTKTSKEVKDSLQEIIDRVAAGEPMESSLKLSKTATEPKTGLNKTEILDGTLLEAKKKRDPKTKLTKSSNKEEDETKPGDGEKEKKVKGKSQKEPSITEKSLKPKKKRKKDGAADIDDLRAMLLKQASARLGMV